MTGLGLDLGIGTGFSVSQFVGLSLAPIGAIAPTDPIAPAGYVFLSDTDGSYFVDADGSYFVTPA